jgi:hypothetical protein
MEVAFRVHQYLVDLFATGKITHNTVLDKE